MNTTRKSEIIIPEELDHVYQIFCEENNAWTSILDETGAYNVLVVVGTDEVAPCPGEHRLIKVVLP